MHDIPERRTFPRRVVHSDWSRDAEKRWSARADYDGTRYVVQGPERTGNLATFFERAAEGIESSSPIVLGFDFPIGVPIAYARLQGISDYLELLPRLGQGSWSDFYELCRTPEEISPLRPFYPHNAKEKGQVSRKHLPVKLGLGEKGWDDLYRRCERKTSDRQNACPLFWTLGAQQVGRAAICGWRDLLEPALQNPQVDLTIWPFAGSFESLLWSHRFVVVETYPAEGYRHLRFPNTGWKKTCQVDRFKRGDELRAWADGCGIALDPTAEQAIEDGFGGCRDGEDRFDAFVGLCSMLDVVLGHRSEGAPDEEAVCRIEGWIFGQQS